MSSSIFSNEMVQNSVKESYSVAIALFSLGGWMKGRGGCVRSFGHEHDFCQAEKAENTDPRTNNAVKCATESGHLICQCFAIISYHIP